MAIDRARFRASTMAELAGVLTRYAAGDLPAAEVDALFQALIDTGLIQYMEDSYQRTARDLVEEGRCSVPRAQE